MAATEDFLNHPATTLAHRLDTLLERPEPPTTSDVLAVFAEWLNDVEHAHTAIVRNPAKGQPDWHPRPVDLNWVRRDIHRQADTT